MAYKNNYLHSTSSLKKSFIVTNSLQTTNIRDVQVFGSDIKETDLLRLLSAGSYVTFKQQYNH